MSGDIQPLDQQFAIVDVQGRPTRYFTQWAQQRQIDIQEAITLQNFQDYLTAHKLIAGSGIGLAPDGNLSSPPTITAKVQEILDQISAVRGTVLYRGAAGWAGLAPGAVGKALVTNGAAADPLWITPNGVTPQQFGAVGDGITDDLAAFNLAHANAAANKAKVYVPGTANGYLISGTIACQAPMFGDGQNTVLKTSHVSADMLQIGVPDVTIQDIHFNSTVTRTGGYYINFNGAATNSNYNSRVERCSFDNWFNGIGFTGAGALNTIRILNCWLTTNVPLGFGITFNTGAPVIDAVLRDIFITGAGAGTQPNRGVSLDYIGDILLDHVSTVYCALGVDIEPTGTHTAQAVFIDNCFFDSGGNSGIRIGGGAGTTVNLVQIHNTWACTNTKGLLINGSGGAIQRVEVVGGYFCNNTSSYGIKADVVQYLDVNGGIFAGNTNGINIAAGVSNFKIRGTKCGTSGLFPVNSGFGINIAAGNSTGFVVEGNDLTGNTGGALSNGATGATGIVENNLGVNPGPTNTIAVGASPFTYTAGYTHETVYVGGGTITGLTVSGQGIGVSTGAVYLGPKQSMTVTYTVAPTMVRSIG